MVDPKSTALPLGHAGRSDVRYTVCHVRHAAYRRLVYHTTAVRQMLGGVLARGCACIAWLRVYRGEAGGAARLARWPRIWPRGTCGSGCHVCILCAQTMDILGASLQSREEAGAVMCAPVVYIYLALARPMRPWPASVERCR